MTRVFSATTITSDRETMVLFVAGQRPAALASGAVSARVSVWPGPEHRVLYEAFSTEDAEAQDDPVWPHSSGDRE
jgi:hypothetical protein